MAKKAAEKVKVARSAGGGEPLPDGRGSSKKRGSSRGRNGAGTLEKIGSLAEGVARAAHAGEAPSIEVPTRAKSNTTWDRRSGILRMGDATQTRELFNLNQAKGFMQTVLHAAGIKELLEADKTLSLRAMFYKGLHTIPGTKEKTFADQDESDAVLEDLEVTLGSLREELHVFAKKAGTMVGNITIVDSGDEIDCRRMGSGGYAIPSIVEPDVIQFKKCDAKFVLHVEKNTVWSRFNEDKFWQEHNCILTEGGGQPPRGVRRLLRRLNEELGLPVYCLLDCDPWGHYIYSVIKQGSISLAFESERLAIPEAKFLGLRAIDYQRCGLSDDVQIALNDKDIARAKQIAAYPWFKDKPAWRREIEQLLRNGFKMEVESLITKDISYVTETYVPERLKARDWLD
ncbi:MAG TPA: DNA topoisomerase IV subunit A [Phycisphaerales bacterium]|nr:DNA topoisomerase IV subunit A [Phycisphaerales bacterium]